ncbi:MAG: hypothetical protein L6R36_005423 [Xanthoria steineri]|nr:MAG: hypothetical protein L6R36_005423 [Xanthoria steineri]
MAASEPEKTGAYKQGAQYLPEDSRKHLGLIEEPLSAIAENPREKLFAVDFLLVDLQLSFRRAEEFQQLLEERRRTLQDSLAAIGNPETAQGFMPALDKGISEVERVRLELEAIWPKRVDSQQAAQNLLEASGYKLRRFDSDRAQLSAEMQRTPIEVQGLKQETQQEIQALHSFQNLLQDRHSAFQQQTQASHSHSDRASMTQSIATTLGKVSRQVDGLLLEHELRLASEEHQVALRLLRRQVEVLRQRLGRGQGQGQGQGPPPLTSSLRRSTRIRKQASNARRVA